MGLLRNVPKEKGFSICFHFPFAALDSLMKKASTIFALQCFLLGAYGCNASSDNLKGGDIKGKKYGTGDQASGTPVSSTASPNNPASSDPSLPASMPSPITSGKIDSNSSEGVTPPSVVTGAYLTCAVDKIDKEKDRATSVCQLRDEKTKKIVDPASTYRSIKWSAITPEFVEILEIKDLVPSKSYWQASFTFKTYPSSFRDVSPHIVYKMNAVRISDGAILKLEETISNTNRPNFYLQSQFAHGAEALRCLDFSFDKTIDRKGTTGGCAAVAGQRMNFNPDGTIGLIFPDANQCMTYDPGDTVNQYVEPAACNSSTLPRPITVWEIRGQELRWKGSTLCLSRVPLQTDPSHDYIGMQKCNGSTDQRWEIIPY